MSLAVAPPVYTANTLGASDAPPSYDTVTTTTTTTTTTRHRNRWLHAPADESTSCSATETTETTKTSRAPVGTDGGGGGGSSGGSTQYTAASSGVWSSYLLRNDGAVARTKVRFLDWDAGKVHKLIRPPEKAGWVYTAVSAGTWASYFLRSDGVVHRVTGKGQVTSEMHAPGTARYVQVSAGAHASYLLRSDGVVDRTRAAGKRQKASFVPPVGVQYTHVSAGTRTSYLTRSDGAVDAVTWRGDSGIVSHTLRCSDPEDGYVAVAEQITRAGDDKGNGPNTIVYLVRQSGALDVARSSVLFASGGTTHTLAPPPGVKYTAASVSGHTAYLLRSDGVVDRTTLWSGFCKVKSWFNPPPNTKYTSVSTGTTQTYLTRSDGMVDVCLGGGVVRNTVVPTLHV